MRQRSDEKYELADRAANRGCIGCNVPISRWGNSDFSQFCMQCRDELGIKSGADARQILDVIEHIPLAEWEKQLQAAEQCRVSRKPVWTRPMSAIGASERTVLHPAVDPAKVAAAVRSLVSYGLTSDDDFTRITVPTAYVFAKNGMFEVRRTEAVDIVLQHSDKPIVGIMTEMRPGVRWNIPKMPYEFLRQTVALFRETCTRKGGSNEAFVRVWWNLTTKTYSILVPGQSVSGGGVHHNDAFDQVPSGEWVVVADIHSHGSGISAFFSGVDDHDEKQAPEGRICGVIGKVTQPLPEWKWRLRTREGFVELKVTDCFDFTDSAVTHLPFTVQLSTVFDTMLDATNVKDGDVRLFCPVDPFQDATCPEEWHAKIATHSHQAPVIGGANPHGWGQQSRVQHVFIKEGTMLVEWEISDNGTTRKTTGKRYQLGPAPEIRGHLQ